MTRDIFAEWLSEFYCDMQRQGRCRVVERLVIAVDRPAANLPLPVSLRVSPGRRRQPLPCEIVFRKVGIVDTQPESEPDASDVRGKSDAEESDADDDETSEPAPIISGPIAMGYIEDLKQLVYAKGLGEEHAAALNKLETALVTSALQKQTAIMDFFAKKLIVF
ncbi:hypothetical protein HPB48_002887 [Haemaphysalis longicornis]|uniref:Uncharacterized protein n=1 Tax=Haemaphysalis longicornis TaxID=44386 RepID=A0A9J6FF45_HAELO|nr:hypothetical protein HPB48_002887 [Haemaphysalis longicornis]